MVFAMMMRVFALMACLAAALPAFAIQEVVIGPRAPSFAAASGAGLGWETLPLPSAGAAYSTAPQRDPRQWAFDSGKTVRLGSFLFNTTSGPSWKLAGPGTFGSSFATGFGDSFGRFGEFGFTSRATTALMASENLMFYTSVGQTTFRNTGSVIPTAPGLALIEPPNARSDIRAGFRVELMPGLTFGAEAAFSSAQGR